MIGVPFLCFWAPSCRLPAISEVAVSKNIYMYFGGYECSPLECYSNSLMRNINERGKKTTNKFWIYHFNLGNISFDHHGNNQRHKCIHVLWLVKLSSNKDPYALPLHFIAGIFHILTNKYIWNYSFLTFIIFIIDEAVKKKN